MVVRIRSAFKPFWFFQLIRPKGNNALYKSMIFYISAVIEDGFCLDENGRDQNFNKINIPGVFAWDKCLQSCRSKSAATACEWHSGGTCGYHTLAVSGGSGHPNFKCEVLGNYLVSISSSYYATSQLLHYY